jgi:hypothetical protein
MKLGAVKAQPAEIDWAAEFGEDEDEFTVEETPEEDVEVEILLKENRQKGRASQNGAEQDKKPQQPQPSYSIRNGDMKLTSALAVPAKSAMSIGRAVGASTTSTSNDAVSTTSSAAASSSSSYSMDGSAARYAAPMPRIDLDTHQVVEPSPYGAFIEIRTMAATIKIIALVHLMLCLVYILLPTFKWMIFPNLGVAAVGLWGAFAYSARLTLAFMTLVCLNVMLMVVFMLLELLNHTIQGSILVIGFLFLVGELFILNYCYQFWKKLPSEGFFTSFRQFFSSNEARIGGFAMDEEEGGL